MTNKIENLCVDIIDAYSNNKNNEFDKYAHILIDEILKDIRQITKIQHYYLVSKALFYVYIKSNQPTEFLVLITYYCLLRCISEDIDITEKTEYNKIAASKLAFILIVENKNLIGGKLLLPLFNNNKETAIYQIIAQLSVFYWNSEYSSINVDLDSELSTRFNLHLISLLPKIKSSNEIQRKKVQEFVYTNIATLIDVIEHSFLSYN